MLAIAALSAGCGLCRREPPMEVSPAAAAVPALAKIRSGAAEAKDLQEAFPKIERAAMNLRFEARRSVFRFFEPRRLRTYLDLGLVADGSPRNARLQGRQVGSQLALYDLAIEGETMRVGIPSANMFFEGPVPPQGTAFHELFGVEPWDIAPIIAAGSRIAWSDPKFLPARDTLTLRPRGPDPLGLESVEFDLKTGLPSASHWSRGRSSWTARYRAWDVHRNASRVGSDSQRAWLAPTRISIKTRQPRATIELSLRREGDAYIMTLNPERLSPKAFKLEPKPGSTELPLESLGELFSLDTPDLLRAAIGAR